MSFDENDLVTIFDVLTGMAFRGTCLAVLVLLFVYFLRKSIHPQVRYLLLILAVLRLTFPIAPVSGLSLFNVKPQTWFADRVAAESVPVAEISMAPDVARPDELENPQPVVAHAPAANPSNKPPIENNIVTPSTAVNAIQPLQNGSQAKIASRTQFSWRALLLAISGLGTALILSRALFAMGQWKAIVSRATENAILQSCANRLLKKMKIRWPVRVVTSPECNQPGLYGLLKPVVILPPWCSELSTADVQLLLQHELNHLRRFDHWTFRFTQGVAALHWWNPVVRRTLTQLRRECELACDQAVLKALPAAERKQYGNLLLEVADRQIANRSTFSAIAFSPTASTLGERVRQSQDFSQPTWRSRVIAVSIVIAVAVFGLTDGLPLAATAKEASVAATQPNTAAPEVVNLKGRYVDQDEKPVAQAYVGIYGGRSTAEPVIKIADGGTDEEGRFHIRGTLPELLREPSASPLQIVAVFWKRGGHATVMRDWTGEAIDEDLTVVTNSKANRIRGRVLDHRGKPVQGATVTLPNRLYAAIPTSHYGLSNVEGEFTIPRLPADLEPKTLWVAHPTFGQMEIRYSNVVSDETTELPLPGLSRDDGPQFEQGFNARLAFDPPSSLLTVTIPEAGAIEGKIVDSATKVPVESCLVTVWNTDQSRFAQVLTNQSGEYQLRVLPGEYRLTVVAGEAEVKHKTLITVEAAKTANVAAISINDDRLSIPQESVGSFWVRKKPDRVKEAAAGSRAYKFLPRSDAVETETKRLLSVLKEQQDEEESGDDDWAETMRSLIQLGSAAVPVLCDELDKTDQTDRLMLRSLPFVLRGIGDTRAVPALIRAIPRCFGRDGSDMGYRCADEELLSFMQKHDHGDHNELLGPEDDYSWGRPVNEVLPALQRLTGRGDGALTLAHVSARKSERHNVLGQRIYNQVAQEWAAFWEQNWKRFLGDAEFRIVDVVPVATGAMPPPPPHDISLDTDSGEGNGYVGSVLSPSGRFVFRDLDTGLRGDLPEQFCKLNKEQRIAKMDQIIAWARKYGFDLMGTEVEHDRATTYVIRAIDMEVWEISKNDFDKPDTMNAMASRGRNVGDIVAHFNASVERYDYPAAAYFCFVTNEGIPGKMLLGVPITSTNLIAGFSDHTKDEFQHTGMYLGRRYALKWLKGQ